MREEREKEEQGDSEFTSLMRLSPRISLEKKGCARVRLTESYYLLYYTLVNIVKYFYRFKIF